MSKAPAIDGNLNSAEWADAAVYNLHNLGSAPMTVKTTAYAGYDEINLYFAMRCEDSRGLQLANLKATQYPYEMESVEIILETDGDVGYKQIQADVLGRVRVNHQGGRAVYELKDERVIRKVGFDLIP